MSKVLVLYYSSYGHIETMAAAVAEGARGVAGTNVDVKRVAELMSDEQAQNAGVQLDHTTPIAEPEDLVNYDAIIFGAPTRFGSVAAQMRNFIDQTGGLWMQGALIGKIGSAFTSAGVQHAGHETTLTSFHTSLLHHGMVIVGVPFSAQELMQTDEVAGGTPYGASTVAGGDGKRTPSEVELTIARAQGEHVAKLTAKLTA